MQKNVKKIFSRRRCHDESFWKQKKKRKYFPLLLLNWFLYFSSLAGARDLIKVVGTKSQYHYWSEQLLLRGRFVGEQRKSNRYYYKKTKAGEF